MVELSFGDAVYKRISRKKKRRCLDKVKTGAETVCIVYPRTIDFKTGCKFLAPNAHICRSETRKKRHLYMRRA